MVDLTSSINLKMSDSGGTEEDLGFYGDVISPLKSTKSSSVESPHSHEKSNLNFRYFKSHIFNLHPLNPHLSKFEGPKGLLVKIFPREHSW